MFFAWHSNRVKLGKNGGKNMHCKYCGQLIEETVKFCPHCGKSTAEETVKAENTNTYESIPSQVVTPVPPVTPTVEQKSKLAAGLLGIFLGGLGIHNFYLGYTKRGLAQLLITILGGCLIIGPMVAGIWGLIEGILIIAGEIKTDANGVPLKD
jgi:TM2 domain-containing membrane protein YozV/predicted RNA-binding Zn-ribbon protein involved in translation (DUF1610 family)